MTQLPLRESDLFLLSFLVEQPQHGYALLSCCRQISSSTLYYRLRNLSARGIISSRRELVNHKTPRQVYFLTKKGRVALKHTLTLQHQQVRQIQDSLLQNFHQNHLTLDKLERLILTLRHQFESQFRKYS